MDPESPHFYCGRLEHGQFNAQTWPDIMEMTAKGYGRCMPNGFGWVLLHCVCTALFCGVQAILFLPLQGHSVQVVPALDSHPFFLLVQTVQIQFSVFSCLSSLLIERALCFTEKMLMHITHTELVFYCFKNQTDLLTIGFSFLLKSKHFRSENEEVRL